MYWSQGQGSGWGTTVSITVNILDHFNPLAWFKMSGRQTETHHCICLGMATRIHYLPLLSTLHSPSPGTSAYLMGLSRLSSLRGVGPWSKGLSQSEASAFVHPLSKLDRKVPREPPVDHFGAKCILPALTV